MDPAEAVEDDEVAVVVEADSEELITEWAVVVVVDSVADPAVDTVGEDMAVATAAAVEDTAVAMLVLRAGGKSGIRSLISPSLSSLFLSFFLSRLRD